MRNNINAILERNKAAGREPGTQGELGISIGIQREYINKIAVGRITPTVPLAMRISQALGFSIEEGVGKVFILE